MNPIARVGTLLRVLLSVLVVLVGLAPSTGRHARTAPAPVAEARVAPGAEPDAEGSAAAWRAAAPHPRRVRPYVPVPITPIPPAEPLRPRASLVRPYVLAMEQQRRRQRADRSRLGVAVLLDIAAGAGR